VRFQLLKKTKILSSSTNFPFLSPSVSANGPGALTDSGAPRLVSVNHPYRISAPGADNEALEFRIAIVRVLIAASRATLAGCPQSPIGNRSSPAASALSAPPLTDHD
jgi:hypothetical protein